MKALEIAEKTRDAILSGKFDQVKRILEITVVCLHELLIRNICVGTY
jgi:hypothetical protein